MRESLVRALEEGLGMGVSFLDVRVEEGMATHVAVTDGRTREVVSPQEGGAGFRAFQSGAWGFSTTNDLTAGGLRRAAREAARLAKSAAAHVKDPFALTEVEGREARGKDRILRPLEDVPVEDKVALALELGRAMATRDKRIVSTYAVYDDLSARLTVANTWGAYVEMPETWILVRYMAWAQDGGLRVRGKESLGGFGGFEVVEREGIREGPRVATDMALRLLGSKAAPAGRFPCIMDQELTGVFSHEAFGHCSEADLVLAGQSVLEGRLGQAVGPEEVTIVDDPRVKGAFGYFPYDWEGMPARKHTLVDHGILRGFMHNLESASRLGVRPNGAARAESYLVPPVVRMSNTYFAPGDWTLVEMMEDMGDGLYLKGMEYGYVDTGKGQFMFKADEAAQVKDGERGQVYRDVSLSGLTLEVLKNIDALGNDFMLTDPGYCGKSAQSMRTTDGGPHTRVKAMVVGGLT